MIDFEVKIKTRIARFDNMFKLSYISLVVVTSFLCGCNKVRKQQSVDAPSQEIALYKTYHLDEISSLKEETIKLSSLVKKIQYTPLETKSDCLLRNAFPKIKSENIFIQSDWIIYRFDKSGKFLNTIGKLGKGPGEFVVNYGYDIDEINKLVYLRSRENKIIVYAYDGEVIDEYKIPGTSTPGLLIERPGQLFVPIVEGLNVSDQSVALSISNRGMKIAPITSQRKQSNTRFQAPIPVLNRNGNKINFMPVFSDTLFSVTNASLTPKAVFSLGRYKFDPFEQDVTEVMNGSSEKNFIFSIMELPMHFLADISSIGGIAQSFNCLVDKRTGSMTRIKEQNGGSLFINDIDGGPLPQNLVICNDSLLVGFLNAIDLMQWFEMKNHNNQTDQRSRDQENLYNMVNQLEENDNPIVIEYVLKGYK